MRTGVEAIADDGRHAVLRRSLHCIRCRYQLRGLSLVRGCPECGLLVERTVETIIDPEASDLPALRNPRAVGIGLLGLTTSMAMAAGLLVARPLLSRIELAADVRLGRWSDLVPPAAPWAAACMLGLGIWCTLLLSPPRGQAPVAIAARAVIGVRVGLLIAALGAVVMAVLDARPPLEGVEQAVVGLVGAAAIWTLLSLRSIRSVIGERSRQYRTGGTSRQGLREMAIAIVGVLAGELIATLARGPEGAPIAFIGAAISVVSVLMLLVGFGYLVVNAAWILRALVKPPPTLADLIRPGPAPAPIPTPIPAAPSAGAEPPASLAGDPAPPADH